MWPPCAGEPGVETAAWLPWEAPPDDWLMAWLSVDANELPPLPAEAVPSDGPWLSCPPLDDGGSRELVTPVTVAIAIGLFVLDQDGFDGIDGSHIVPFFATSRPHDSMATSVVALHAPSFHQDRLTIIKGEGLRITPNRFGQDAAGATIAMLVMFGAGHGDKRPSKGPYG